jgi:hypothetical protein
MVTAFPLKAFTMRERQSNHKTLPINTLFSISLTTLGEPIASDPPLVYCSLTNSLIKVRQGNLHTGEGALPLVQLSIHGQLGVGAKTCLGGCLTELKH